MGLKEPGLRGSLRNVSVGIRVIPDRGVYIQDDWGDGNLSPRDDSNTREQTIGGNTYDTTYRPDWTSVDGSPSASADNSGYMEIEDNETVETDSVFAEDDMAIYIRWRMTGTTAGSGRRRVFHFWADESADYRDSGNAWYFNFNPGDGDQVYNLTKLDGGSETNVIDGSVGVGTSEHETEIIRLNGEDWELKHDGQTVGTATDSFAPTADASADKIHIQAGSNADAWRILDFYIGAPGDVPSA